MSFFFASQALTWVLLAVTFSACSPSLNWRETRIGETGLTALFPCKPDQIARLVPLASAPVEIHLTACDAGGASFAISHAEFIDGRTAQEGLANWRKATLANMSTGSAIETPIRIRQSSSTGTVPFDSAVRMVKADGKRQDGSNVGLNGVWLVSGKRVFHAAIYAPKITAEMSETFFSGLGFQ